MRSSLCFVAAIALWVGCSSNPDVVADGDPPRELPEATPAYQSGVEVDVEGGLLRGRSDGDLRIFHAVPYAAAPVADLRFRPPAPVVPWQGVRDATAWGPSCPQGAGLAGPTGTSEDCLELNVWAYDDGKERPVMVFIHGGAFFGGSATQGLYEAAKLARRGDVNVVTINYRLGVLGFLASPLLAADAGANSSGNYGLKDQAAALEWVQRNIEVFGGAAGNVTVFGESAGGISICALMGAPAVDGLYQKAIIQSGVGCNEFAEADQPTTLGQMSAHEAGEQLIAELGCDDAADPVACLRDLDVDTLVSAIDTTDLLSGSLDGALLVGPHVDGEFVVEQPLARIARGDIDVPTIIGTTGDEATLFFSAVTVITRVDLWFTLEDFLGSGELADSVLEIYSFLEFPIAKSAFLTFVTDMLFSCPNLAVARAMADGESTYLYEFQRVSPQFLALGSFHALELAHLFGNFDAMAMLPLSADTALAETMQRAWTDFAHDGVPALSAGWPALEPGQGEFAVLDQPASVQSVVDFRGGRCEELADLDLVAR